MITVGDIYAEIDKIAPFCLAEKNDNSGLLVGEKSAKVKKVLVSLDITKDVAIEAVKDEYDLIISHHPVIFNPLYTLCKDNPAVFLAKNNKSAICAHTNLDIARGGINDIIAEKLDLTITHDVIETVHEFPFHNISVFVPQENVAEVQNAMHNAGAGVLGNYKNCSFFVEGTGTFLPLEGSNAYIGQIGKTENVSEVRLEMIVSHDKKSQVIKALLDAHPYETVAYNLFENYSIIQKFGLGKVGKLKNELSAKQLAEVIKKTFGNTVVRYNDTGKPIKTVAFCSGGGGRLAGKAISLGADAYISGDIKHDQFIDANNAGLTVFDAGHFHTENIVLEYLEETIKNTFPDLKVVVAKSNRDILSYE